MNSYGYWNIHGRLRKIHGRYHLIIDKSETKFIDRNKDEFKGRRKYQTEDRISTEMGMAIFKDEYPELCKEFEDAGKKAFQEWVEEHARQTID